MTTGTVHLVGAGPGDPDLLTVRATKLIEEADVVLADSLVGDGILGRIEDDRLVDVGKKPADGERATQAEIHERLVREAQAGNDVVRLKGGDPTVFGRGGEEMAYLVEHDVPFEVVPGVTSAIGVPETNGIPLTHRDHASSLTVVSGHGDPTESDGIDWGALARSIVAGGTLVILMGVRRLPDNVAVLREHGVPADTPVAMIERGTCDGEVAVSGDLGTIVERARETGIAPPAVTVVGDVVSIREDVTELLADGTHSPTSITESEGQSGVPDSGWHRS